MLRTYHLKILHESLHEKLSSHALESISNANIKQDAIRGQFGHDEYHFDNNAFNESYAYIEKNRAQIRPALEADNVEAAWAAFGRLTHTAQDFYAHSNYIRLWMVQFDGSAAPPVPEVAHAEPSFLEHPDLRSGKLYYPLELFSYIPALKKYILPLLPRDSHAWMNLDSPKQGPLFDYAHAAAVKRTNDEWKKTLATLPKKLHKLFHGR
ncbi:MAG: hypothetical protein HN855_13110 [Anaerolineae bacterium]|jgi:hypothetical protein|nr:hypothetical protein [Anaerolineae bacterium]MBT7072276.1 hypothetical protein [Anaerolineae bacterium]MBT7326093.1 hypothetical protein [Anaerolineae bacterium]